MLLFVSSALGALPKDGNGWSILTPSADTRLIYVSSVSGNDSTGTYYLPSDPLIGSDPTNPTGAIKPYATYAAAYAVTRDGYPDWVLFKKGETWTTGLSGMHNGRGDTERMVVTGYGSSTTRPLFKTGTSGFLSLTAGSGGRYWIQNIAIVGLHAYCQQRDPSSPDFAGFANGPTGINFLGQDSNGYQGELQNMLIEDNQVEWYSDNICIQSGKNADDIGHDLAFRRNVINNAYDIDTAHRAQGFFCYGLYNITLEDNVFVHNGWYTQGNGGSDGSGGKATIYNHNTYFDAVDHVTFSDNMFLQASSIGTKWCADDAVTPPSVHEITIDNNLYVEGELGAQIGGNGVKAFGFANITFTHNVEEGLGRTAPTGRGTLGWGLWEKDWNTGLIQNNLFIRQDSTSSVNVYAISLDGVSNKNVVVDSNTIYQMYATNALIQLANKYQFSGISLTNNIVDTNAYTSQIASQTSSTFTHYTLNNNHYYSGAAAGSWFQIAGANKSFAQWQSAAGESGSTTGHTTFADATRTVETYDTAQSGPGTFADFITQAKLQSKANWRTAWTANAVNTWIRAGFSTYMAPVANNDSYSTYKNTALNQSAPGVLGNDTVTQGYTLTAVKVTDPGHGTLTLNSNGSFTYTPTNGWSGSDSFTYKAYDGTTYSNVATVTLTVTNRAPVANNDSYATNMSTALNQSAPGVLANDTDADGDTLTATKVTDPAHGTLTLNSNGSFTYTPTTGWSGTDSFTYKAYDGTAYSGNATVTLTVRGTFYVDATYNSNTPGWGVDHFATVQSAINAAVTGMTIQVNQGTYTEHINFSGKNLTLTSTNPSSPSVVAATILDGGSNGTVVTFANSETSAAIIEGFTIQHGAPSGIVNSASPTISQNVIQNNTTTADGAGILVSSGAPTIMRNIITGNTASAQNGGGIAIESGSPVVKDNLIRGNTCYWNGGGIFAITCTPTIIGNTIANNTVQYSTCKGGGIRFNGVTTSVTNNILWGNTAPGGGNQMALKTAASITVSYCDVSGGQAGIYLEDTSAVTWGSGNLTTDPVFVNSTSDFHLQSTSPCIDAANGSVASTVDLEGNARYDYPGKTNTGTGTPNYVDIGCYEYH